MTPRHATRSPLQPRSAACHGAKSERWIPRMEKGPVLRHGALHTSVKRDDYAERDIRRRLAPMTSAAPAPRVISANGSKPVPPPVRGNVLLPAVVDVVPWLPIDVVVEL